MALRQKTWQKKLREREKWEEKKVFSNPISNWTKCLKTKKFIFVTDFLEKRQKFPIYT